MTKDMKAQKRAELKQKIRERLRAEWNPNITAWLLLTPALVCLLTFTVFPICRSLYLSMCKYTMITPQPQWIGLKNYDFLIGNAMFSKAFINTCFFTIGKLTGEVVLALLLAVLLDMKVPCRKWLRMSYFAPVIVPVVAASTIWMWLYDPSVGPLNELLRMVGLPTSNYIFSADSALASIVVFAVWRGVGYDIIIFLSGLQGISDDVIEAARIDGANEWNILTAIKLPLMAPIISFVIMMGMIGCFQAFTEVDIMTQGGPNNATILVVNYIYNQAFGNAKMGRGAAASVLLFAVIFVLTLIQKTMSDRKEAQ